MQALRQYGRAATALVVLAMLALFAVGFAGCQGKAPSQTSTAKDGARSEATASQAEIEDQLKSALYQLQPDKLGVESQLGDAVSVLNNWWSAVESADLVPTGLTPQPAPLDRVPEPFRARLEQKSYDLADGTFIRGAYFARAIAYHIADQTDDELDRAVRIFQWVCRNVALAPEDEPLPPLTFYELLIVGRGRPADRAWVFGDVLKQLRIDSVVLQAKSEGGPPAPLVVGVPLDGEVYLFDPQLGLPIPRGDDGATPQISRPATLREIREHPEWLKALAPRSDQPYEPTAEQLASAAVQVIAEPSAWTPRMWNLEQLLPSASLCVLYDAPEALSDAPGLFARVAAADAAWTAESVGLWLYPLERDLAFASLDPRKDPNAIRLAQEALLPFSVPLEERKDADDRLAKELEAHQDWLADKKGDAPKAKAGKIGPSMYHLKTRTLQLQGQLSDAISKYVIVRQLSVTPPPDPNWGPIYQHAAQDAFYWSGVTKYEQGEFDGAIMVLADYIKRYRRGRWVGPAGLLLAECHRELGRMPEAIQAVKTAPPDDAYRATNAILARRWTEAAKVPRTE